MSGRPRLHKDPVNPRVRIDREYVDYVDRIATERGPMPRSLALQIILREHRDLIAPLIPVVRAASMTFDKADETVAISNHRAR